MVSDPTSLKVDTGEELADMIQNDKYSCQRLGMGRLYGYFFLSSVLTCCGCLLLVLGWRALNYFWEVCRCGQGKSKATTAGTAASAKSIVAPKSPSAGAGKEVVSTPGAKGATSPGAASTGGTKNGAAQQPMEVGWASEAKVWIDCFTYDDHSSPIDCLYSSFRVVGCFGDLKSLPFICDLVLLLRASFRVITKES